MDSSTVVTSAHAVTRSVAVAVLDQQGQPIPARISGLDLTTGVAVLALDHALSAPAISLGNDPVVGEWMTTVAIPSAGHRWQAPEAAQVERTDRSLVHRDVAYRGLALLPGLADFASAGAPAVDETGAVRGMLLTVPKQTSRTVVPVRWIRDTVDKGSQSDEVADCSRPTGPASQTAIAGDAPSAVKKGLTAYFGGINEGDYARAFAALGPNFHRPGSSLAGIADGWVSTYDFNITVQSVTGSATAPKAWITFDSIFESGRGPDPSISCARWSLNYTFRRDGSRFEINTSKPHVGDRSWSPC